MDKENMIYIYIYIYISVQWNIIWPQKRDEELTHAKTWRNPENAMLN